LLSTLALLTLLGLLSLLTLCTGRLRRGLIELLAQLLALLPGLLALLSLAQSISASAHSASRVTGVATSNGLTSLAHGLGTGSGLFHRRLVLLLVDRLVVLGGGHSALHEVAVFLGRLAGTLGAIAL